MKTTKEKKVPGSTDDLGEMKVGECKTVRARGESPMTIRQRAYNYALRNKPYSFVVRIKGKTVKIWRIA